MKIGLISDIHGNYEALKAVLGELDAMDISEIYCLGDVVGYYPQINECCDALKSRQISSIMGNHDWYMASGGFCNRSQSVNNCIAYLRKIITVENLNWLSTFPVQRKVYNIHMVHGGWSDPIDEYLLKPSDEYFSKIEGEVFFSGHTHVQLLEKFDKKIYCNPGSVGQPRDGDPKAAFSVYHDTGEISLHRVRYDPQKIFDLMSDGGYNENFYNILKTGTINPKRL